MHLVGHAWMFDSLTPIFLLTLVEIGQNITNLFATTYDYELFTIAFRHFWNYSATNLQLFWYSSFHVNNI
jgi:hypothetical protein